MINEYLFLSDKHRATVEAYKPDGITVNISSVENKPLWIAAFSLVNKNENSAKKLSDIHTTVMQYSPLVLSCESSEYYNRLLFPLVNELERKLRKLLYLAASFSDSEKAKENIKQLEEKDFGEIFDLLFTDPNFILDMKKRINAEVKSEFNGRSKYSKKEIKVYLDSLVEYTLWDVILSEEDVPSLRSQFRDVQSYRNDVMHAHNIGKELFGKARYLFEKINMELDSAISKLIGTSEDVSHERKSDVNTAISSAITAMDLSTLTDAFKGMTPMLSSTVLTEALRDLDAVAIKPAITETLKSIQSLKENSALIEALKSSTAFQISPAIENFRRQMSQLSEAMRPYQQMFDALRPYNTLQESSRSLTEGLPHNFSIDDKPDDTDEVELKTDKSENNPKEGNPNE